MVIVNRFDRSPLPLTSACSASVVCCWRGREEVLGSQEVAQLARAETVSPFAATADDPEPLPPGPRVVA